jgi:hypothetical protein
VSAWDGQIGIGGWSTTLASGRLALVLPSPFVGKSALSFLLVCERAGRDERRSAAVARSIFEGRRSRRRRSMAGSGAKAPSETAGSGAAAEQTSLAEFPPSRSASLAVEVSPGSLIWSTVSRREEDAP